MRHDIVKWVVDTERDALIKAVSSHENRDEYLRLLRSSVDGYKNYVESLLAECHVSDIYDGAIWIMTDTLNSTFAIGEEVAIKFDGEKVVLGPVGMNPETLRAVARRKY